MDKILAAEKLLLEQDKTIAQLAHHVSEFTEQLEQLKQQQHELREVISSLKDDTPPASTLHENEPIAQIEPSMARELSKEHKKVIQLKNGQVNIPFSETINLVEFGIPPYAPILFEGIEQLKWDAEQHIFEGTPVEAGEFIGIFKYQTISAEGQTLDHEKEVHFLINPDPRTLWQSIDPPEEAPYFKPNSDFAIEQLDDRMVTALSVRGKSHAHKGSFREDHLLIHCHPKDWVIQIISDGAGSAKYSRQGSKLACEATLASLLNYIDGEKMTDLEKLLEQYKGDKQGEIDTKVHQYVNELCTHAALHAHQEITQFADDADQSIRSFASTLLFALTKTFKFGTVVVAFAIGDGAIAAIETDLIQPMMTPDGGEYSGQTRFVTMPELFTPDNRTNLNKRVQISICKKHTATLLMTDGVSDPKFGTDNKLKDTALWRDLWTDLETIISERDHVQENLTNWLDFYIPGEYDDRTISILA